MYILQFSSCLVFPGLIEEKVARYPEVEEVLMVKDQTNDFAPEIAVGVLLKNGGTVFVSQLDYWLGGKHIYIKSLGDYEIKTEYFRLYRGDSDSKWHRGRSNIRARWLEEWLGYPVRPLKKIIETYDDLLAFIERIHREPPVPVGTWDHETLKKYTGYIYGEDVTGEKFRAKIYIMPKESSQTFWELLESYKKIEGMQ
jgi:hypothetical protein